MAPINTNFQLNSRERIAKAPSATSHIKDKANKVKLLSSKNPIDKELPLSRP
jgi:hypothetical protein